MIISIITVKMPARPRNARLRRGCDHKLRQSTFAKAIHNATGIRLRDYPLPLDRLPPL